MISVKDESQLGAALWAGDVDELNRLAGCICCCYEHTFESCPARAWDGCRGSGNPDTRAEREAWERHYAEFHGMTWEQFYGYAEVAP